MCGFYYHFNNLRFNQSQQINEFPAAHVIVLFALSEILKGRLLKWLLDHRMNHARASGNRREEPSEVSSAISNTVSSRKLNLERWAQALGDLNFQRAFWREHKQWFWDLRPSIGKFVN